MRAHSLFPGKEAFRGFAGLPVFRTTLALGLLVAWSAGVCSAAEGEPSGAAVQARPASNTKLPSPAEELQREVRGSLAREYRLHNARTSEAKRLAARELLGAARDSDEPVNRFVLLRLAMELASESGDAEVVVWAIDSISQDFAVVPLRVKSKVLPSCASHVRKPAQAAVFIACIDTLVGEALGNRDIDTALTLAKAAFEVSARSPGGQRFRDHVAEQLGEVAQLVRSMKDFQKACETLKSDPDNAPANLQAGRWYGFMEEDWNRGLPLLAKGSNRKLKALAENELASSPRQPGDEVRLGDMWWLAGDSVKAEEKPATLRRAGFWYGRAIDSLEAGQAKSRVEQRLSVIDQISPPLLARAGRQHASTARAEHYVCTRKGDDANPGTRAEPWKTLARAAKVIRPGDTVIVLPGLYRGKRFDFGPAGSDTEHRTVFKFALPDNCSGRAVLTGLENDAPDFALAPNTRIEGLWIGGDLPKDPDKSRHGFTNQAGIEMLRCTVWASRRGLDKHMYGLLCGNTAVNMTLADNLFVHLGGHWFGHAIYISGGPPPTTQDCRFVGNVFVQGGGYAMHCWHAPKNITMVANFVSGHTCSMVAQGPGHIIHHNVFWRPQGKPDDPGMNIAAQLPNDVLRFDHNLMASTRPTDGNGKSLAPPVHNYCLARKKGGNLNLVPLPVTQVAALPWVGQTPTELDAAIAVIDSYFATHTPEQIAADTSPKVEDALRVLRVKYKRSREDEATRPVQ